MAETTDLVKLLFHTYNSDSEIHAYSAEQVYKSNVYSIVN